MAPRRKNQESDLPQPFVEEGQMDAGGAGYLGSSDNLVREEVPPQLVPTADLGGAVASLLQMMEENRKLMEENHQQVTLQLKSLDERYESYNSRVDRCLSQVIEVVNKNKSDFDEFINFLISSVATLGNRSLYDVNFILNHFNNFNGNGNMNIPSAGGHSSQPRQEHFSCRVNNQPLRLMQFLFKQAVKPRFVTLHPSFPSHSKHNT
ncbi:hypothetical protein LINGRAHAP2_LOCUS22954 [Linum grandiflorum]